MIHLRRLLFASVAIAAALLILPAPANAQSATRKFDQNVFIDAARGVLPAVVNISIEEKVPEGEEAQNQRLRRLFMDQGMNLDGPFRGSVTGSGVLVRREGSTGYVITNSHVIEPLDDKSMIKLTFHQREEGSTEYNHSTVVAGDTVRVIGRDELSDLAVIEFLMPQELDVQPAEFGDSEKLEIGEFVLALGNPLNFNHTVTQGIISGKSRYLGSRISLERLLQTDVVIQPGNSGGPLVNLDGRIIGINNAIFSQTGYWQGTSFAIPGNEARRIAFDLIDKGRVQRGYLGVNMRDVARAEVMSRYKLTTPQGVLVDLVVPNSPADLAGVRRDDVILQVDGEQVSSPDHLLRLITAKGVDAKITLDVVRLSTQPAQDPMKMQFVARLTERPDERVIRDMHISGPGEETPLFGDGLGVAKNLGLLFAQEKDGLRIREVFPNSVAEEAGLQQGDLIKSLNGAPVKDLPELMTAMAKALIENQPVSLTIDRNGKEQEIRLDRATP